uniref:Phage protein n=1 Tax=Rhabditophanes sp. KR3021 TaxID=114890 RepID=A0AC35UE97_9BILA
MNEFDLNKVDTKTTTAMVQALTDRAIGDLEMKQTAIDRFYSDMEAMEDELHYLQDEINKTGKQNASLAEILDETKLKSPEKEEIESLIKEIKKHPNMTELKRQVLKQAELEDEEKYVTSTATRLLTINGEMDKVIAQMDEIAKSVNPYNVFVPFEAFKSVDDNV